MPPPFCTACSCSVSPARITFAAAGLGQADQVGQVRAGASSTPRRSPAASPGRSATGPRAPRRPGRWPRNWALLYDSGTPAARVLRADWDGGDADRPGRARPPPTPWPTSARTRVLPDPAGALITDTRRPSVSTDSAAAAWSSRSPIRCAAPCASCARRSSACSSCVEVRAERLRGVGAGHARRAVCARACATMRSSMASCARVA